MKIEKYIEESCVIQHATDPKDYIGMALAFVNLHLRFVPRYHIDCSDVIRFGQLVNNNRENAFRVIPVCFVNGTLGTAPQFIERQLRLLLRAANTQTIEPDEFYQSFEEIHPFLDGNGRVGSLLWNFYMQTMDSPQHPPEFKTT